ncbi:helix-turn-helix domain-containing protein [Rhodoblastus sp.]|uniref:helix-turn-helix domain-containing protein n=1 Tax=Rhodoblastus sp. TaxID=1962975 RepID=UPI0025D69D2D|nr:helix-turn-helix domain-containing protein [Rhodoblastus sp.]
MLIPQTPGLPGTAPNVGKKALFAERLRAVMAEKQLSVSSLAKLVQNELPGEAFNPVNISHYRAGRSMPRPRILRALTQALGASFADIAPSAAEDAFRTPPAITGEQKVPVDDAGADPDLALLAANDATAGAIPSFHLEDLAGGEAWLQINQRLSWSTVIKILQALKGKD